MSNYEEITSKDKKIVCKFIKDIMIKSEYPEYEKKYLSEKQINNKINNKKYNKEDIRKNILTAFYDKHLFRLSLSCKLGVEDNNKQEIIVILMNPSYADQHGLDATLNNVKSFLEEYNNKNKSKKQYGKFIVFNIFPIRMADSKCLHCINKKYSNDDIKEHNIKYIQSQIKNNTDILVAWGADYHNDKETIEICERLKENKNMYAYNLNTKGSPTHFAPQIFNKIKEKGLQRIPVLLKKENDKFLFVQDKQRKIEKL